MMETVGAALGAFGLLGLLGTAIEVTQSGFVAKDRKSQVRLLSGQLDFEAVLLRRWAENVLLVGDGESDSIRVLPTEYRKLINDKLDSMIDLFSESAGLVAKYRDDGEHEALSILHPQPQSDKRLFRLISSRKIERRSSFRWAIRDSTKLETLVRHLESFRRKLEELLPQNVELLKLQILVDTVSTSTPDNMESIRGAALAISRRSTGNALVMDSIQSAVSIRQKLPQWKLEADNSQAIVQKLFIQDFSFTSDLPHNLEPWYTSLSSTARGFNSESVLVEWRCSESGIEKFIFERDIIQLANLLFSITKHPDAHLPSCLGYIKDEKFHLGIRYGLVLAIPAPGISRPSTSGTSKPISLHDEILRKPYPLPDLSVRLDLARALAISLIHLIAPGWLHKGIRSSNILLLNPPCNSSTPSADLLQDSAFLLTGFQFARQNLPGQVSLNAKDSAALDLYRHPSAASTEWRTEEYRRHGYLREFDIYSFGVVLAEIGLWKTVGQVADKARSKGWIGGSGMGGFREILLGKVKGELGGMMGAQFRGVVEYCLKIEQEADEDVNEVNILESFQEEVFKVLDGLNV